IPAIEEFHVGFEYEIYSQDEWKKDILMPQDYDYPDLGELAWIENMLFINKIRVKYLDKEDIIELDWKITKDKKYEFDAQYLKQDYIFWDLTYDIEDHKLIIEEFYQSKLCAKTSYTENPNLYNSKIIFDGTIKNKSELQILCKQLGIL